MSSPEQSPRETEEVEAPNEDDLQIDENQANMSRDNPALDYDFEVKEQDRWLPIANGEWTRLACCATHSLARVPARCLLPQICATHTPLTTGNGDQRRLPTTYNAVARVCLHDRRIRTPSPTSDLQLPTYAAEWTNNDALFVPTIIAYAATTVMQQSLQNAMQFRR